MFLKLNIIMKKYLLFILFVFMLSWCGNIWFSDKKDYITNECSNWRCEWEFYVKWLSARLQETRCYITTQDKNPNCWKNTKEKWDIVLEWVSCYKKDKNIVCDVLRPFTWYNIKNDHNN